MLANNIAYGTPLDALDGTTYGQVKYGFGLNAEQQLTHSLGAFCRIGYNDGQTATWAFTEIDRSFSAGLSLNGEGWKRKDDNAGLALMVNGISAAHRDYLAAGGYGFIIGDGKLTNYQTENIIEAYYSARINPFLFVSADYQLVQHPAYNADRGPVNLFALRAHVEF